MGRPIDADALVEMFKTQYGCETCDNYEGIRCRACHCDDALGIIDSVPTLDVQPVRRGEWLEVDPMWKGVCQCSACGTCTGMTTKALSEKRKDYYCSECGADMREVRTDDV